MPSDFEDDEDTAAFLGSRGRGRRIRRGLIPQSRTGRIFAVLAGLSATAGLCYGAAMLHGYVLSDIHFRIPDSSAIELEGNAHVTRPQMLSILGGDVERNLFSVPLEDRRKAIEQIPWVEHATVMRLLPNRLRVHIAERTPVAFTRQGDSIGMVDAHGVLLSMPADAAGNPSYSFPVVTGVNAADSPDERAARLHTFSSFVHDLDSAGKPIAAELSEVDLSDPEDVKALIPDRAGEVLVHFGSEDFLARYNRYEEHIADWHSQYPRLSSVDMRYERQIVLQQSASHGEAGLASSAASIPGAAHGEPAHPVSGKGDAAVHASASTGSVTAAGSVTTSTSADLPSRPLPAAGTAPRGATARAVSRPAAKPGAKAANPKRADTARKVEAIRAWMAQRDKLRGTAAAKGAPANTFATRPRTSPDH